MGNRILVKTGGLILIALGTLVPIEAKAFPFETTPEGFLSYLNSGRIVWDDASKQTFYNPRRCYLNSNTSYGCGIDFDIVTALGKRTCINYTASYSMYTGRVIKISSSDSECSKWEKVVETPPEPTHPPQPEPAPVPQPATPAQKSEPDPTQIVMPTDNGKVLTKQEALIGGSMLLSLGFIIGLILKRKGD